MSLLSSLLAAAASEAREETISHTVRVNRRVAENSEEAQIKLVMSKEKIALCVLLSLRLRG